jgi:sugar phosphate isomerase/epimerase
MKLAFTTLGCPNWDLDTICQKGREYGYDGVDFRGYQNEIDITRLSLFTKQGTETKQRLADAGLTISGVSSSIKVCEPERKTENIDEAKRTIELAHKLGFENVRVFGGGDIKRSSHEELAKIGLECVQAVLNLDGASELHWLFETHDNWVTSTNCTLLLNQISNPAFGALWDIGHTARVGGETPEQTWAAIGSRVSYTHVKDAIYDTSHPQAMSDGWRYVLPGAGQLPLVEGITILRTNGYDGWIMYELEKRWHPDLEEPEVAFPAFVQWVKPLITMP